jgi:hypothetical protein
MQDLQQLPGPCQLYCQGLFSCTASQPLQKQESLKFSLQAKPNKEQTETETVLSTPPMPMGWGGTKQWARKPAAPVHMLSQESVTSCSQVMHTCTHADTHSKQPATVCPHAHAARRHVSCTTSSVNRSNLAEPSGWITYGRVWVLMPDQARWVECP